MAFVVAWKSGNKEITYRDQGGRTMIKRGGSRSWRNFNPGNIIDGTFADNHGAIGDDIRMAIFPDEAAGRSALIALLTGQRYKNLSIRDAMYRYAAPSDNNHTEAYIRAIVDTVIMPETAIIADLSTTQLDKFADAVKRYEGWKVGDTIGAEDDEAVASDRVGGIDPRVRTLIDLGKDTRRCEELRLAGRKPMVPYHGIVTVKSACAATLSAFLKAAGITLDRIEAGAGDLARYVERTLNWRRIGVGEQEAGDIGVCRDDDPTPPEPDHIFFVTKRVDDDEMMIVDNQESFAPHTRFASVYGDKPPVEYFLTLRPQRAGNGGRWSSSQASDDEGLKIDPRIVVEDQDTNDLVVRFTPEGQLL